MSKERRPRTKRACMIAELYDHRALLLLCAEREPDAVQRASLLKRAENLALTIEDLSGERRIS